MNGSKIRILAADDEEDILEILQILLEEEEYEVMKARNGFEAVEMADETVDLIILDVAMPGKDGFATCREIRKKSVAPVLFLTAKTQESDKVKGFSAGGDDYLSKPFSNVEFISRVNALLRRCYVYQPSFQKEQIYECGDLKVDMEIKKVTAEDQEVMLTPIEYDLLALMIQFPKKVFSAQNLYESIWNQEYSYLENNTIVVHISNLRKKIEEDPKNPKHIKSMWGRGYYVE